jgi:diguanylate cyclase (GGDEF)-like protein
MAHHRLLVADENQSFLEKTAEILTSVGIKMIPLTTGARVLTLCQQEQPDGALIHADLPALSGVEVCRRLKTQVDPTLPVVLMFSEDLAQAGEIAAQCKADNYLFRPLKRTELLYCVRGMMQTRLLLREVAAVARLDSGEEGKPSAMIGLDMFHSFLTLELRRADRYGFPLSVISVAVDPLPEDASVWSRALDDQLGPALASAIRSTLRDIDVSTMLSNRELLVLMPHTDREGATLVGKRICRTISAQAYHFGRSRIQPTVSVGVACIHGESINPEELLARVKRYRSRAADAGGNRVFSG